MANTGHAAAQRLSGTVQAQHAAGEGHPPAQDRYRLTPNAAQSLDGQEHATQAVTDARTRSSSSDPPHETKSGRTRRTGTGSGLPPDPIEEGFLDGLARLAQRGDRQLRDRLYERFSPYLDRVCASLARRAWVRLAELDDIRHEGYLVFCTLLTDWPGEERFAGFLFAHFARRLTAAVRRFEGLRPRGPLAPPPTLDATLDDGAATMAVLELLTGLDAAERTLLELLLTGYSLREAAARLGISERTARRRLRRLGRRLRATPGHP
nr:sigma-70 family RNA polymerase sigma factor [Thermomicrobium sp. CFH 73360]